MTLGDFINYILFTGLMAAPVVQIASIGTQISEAFAGLDRIRELMHDDDRRRRGQHARRRSTRSTARSTFEDVSFEYNAGRAGAEARQLQRAGRHDDGAGRIERVGQEHARSAW